MKKNNSLIVFACVIGLLAMPAIAVKAADPKSPEMVISLDVTPKAQITEVSIKPGKWANQPAVWVNAKIKNTSDQPVQYKTKCYFHGTDISRGFMVPKVGKPLIKPGAVGTAKYPFPSSQLPQKFTIQVVDFSLED